MGTRPSLIALSLALSTMIVACVGPGAPGLQEEQQKTQAQQAMPQRTLAVAVRGEPPSIAAKPVLSFSGLLDRPTPLFNAQLDFYDEREIAHPYLAEALPSLNTDSWRLFPDGRMETTYRLKSDLAWHDGTSLIAEDFVFAYEVYATPDLGHASTPPIGPMERVSAPDPRTVVIRWKELYADAGVLDDDFAPLPQHLLREPFRNLELEAFAGLPFWSSEYVGLGPYQVAGWETGAFIEGQAFDGYVFGRPKIDRITVVFIPEDQTALANVLAGEVHYVSDYVLSIASGEVLEKQWTQNQGGTVLYTPTTLRYTGIQLRPDHVESPALLDIRVRRALAYGIDSRLAVDVLTAGKGVPTDTLTSPRVTSYREIEPATRAYGYDPRRTQTLMEEAGFTKGPNGFFVGSDGQPLRFSVSSTSGVRNETVASTFADSLRRSGFDVNQTVVPVAQMRLPETSALVPGLQVRGGNNEYRGYTSELIPRPENGWRGSNYGGWSNPGYDRAFEGWLTTLEQSERVKHIAEMERILREQVPIIPHFFDVQVNPHLAALQGPVARHTPGAGGPFLYIHQWEWRS